MPESALHDSQMEMARYLRDPQRYPAPAGIEPRRLQVYEDLVYKNIEGFVRGGFPVLFSLYQSHDWEQLVRSFMRDHRCHTPFFLEISQEFVRFLMEYHQPRPCDPPFLVELAHYEWVELALDVAESDLPPQSEIDDLLAASLHLSPLAWVLQYRFPVHLIGPQNRPQSADEATYLAVYRDRADEVNFMSLNAATARLLELLRDQPAMPLRELLTTLANELGADVDTVLSFGVQQVAGFVACDLVLLASTQGQLDPKVAPLRTAE
tara:strand:- start:15396 stop:16190 length:795 start_codon:yes stop_codon:yes gene_type:complete